MSNSFFLQNTCVYQRKSVPLQRKSGQNNRFFSEKAGKMPFNFLEKENAFTRNEEGLYAINFEEMKAAVAKLGGEILKAQGDGNYEFVKEWIATDGVIKPALQSDLDKVNGMGIPTDIYYEMSPELLIDNSNK